MTRDRELRILDRIETVPGIVTLTLEADEEFLDEALPGRFVQVEIPDAPFPLVRRPFTIARTGITSFSLMFEVAGRGTKTLYGVSRDNSLRVLGPLGSGYRLGEGKWLLIGGGMGAAGFPCLADRVECGMLLLGASNSGRLLELPGVPARCITEDGSSGERGFVTDLLEDVDWDDFSSIALCGPVAMMKAVMNRIPDEAAERVQVSTEARMGCGWGACEGCSIPAIGGGYLKCCTDGPVIPADMIDWQRWEGV